MDQELDQETEKIYNEFQGGGESNPEIPMTNSPAEEPAPNALEYEYTADGKQIKEPLEQILKRASQGYHYAQKMAEYNQQRQEFDQKYKTYQEIDNYANSNPDWWNYIQDNWKNRGQAPMQEQTVPDASIEAHPILKNLVSEFEELKKFKHEIEAEKNQRQREEEDHRLSEEIESIRKTYPDIDLSAISENGKSLEKQVLEYAINNGIKSFKTAFRDFNHDRLVKIAEERGKELVAKDIQKRSKLGLLGESSTPKKQLTQAQDIKNKSYSDLLQEALNELQIN